MTMSMYYKIFVWFFLIGVLEVVANTGISPNILMDKLYTKEKSIFINGERVNFDDWISGIIQKYDVFENDINAIKMFTFVKCECAYMIHSSIDSIIPSVKPCSKIKFETPDCPTTEEVEPCAEMNKDAIDKLRSLNVNIKLAISRLLQIVELHPNLKSGESYFSRTLLEVSFYVESLAHVEIRGTISNNMYMLDPMISMKILQNIKRVLLQILNLIGQFAHEYCYPNEGNDKNGVVRRDLNKELKVFLGDLHASSSKWQLNMGILMLENCMQDNNGYKTKNNALTFCNEYVKTAKIVRIDRDRPVYLGELFKAVQYSYELPIIYEYMLAIYQVIMKLIYLKTQENWMSLDEEWCERIISKLKSMYCPIDIINHFQTLLHIKRVTNEVKFEEVDRTAREFFEGKFISVINVKLDLHDLHTTRFDDAWKTISLSDLMKFVLEDAMFEQYWLAFNFMFKDFAKKSAKTYDMALNLLPEEKIQVRSEDRFKSSYEEECSILTKFVTEYLSQITPESNFILENLFNKLDNDLPRWKRSENNIFKIYSVARIQLENFNELQYKNGEMLMRTVNLIWNTVDNYKIKNCVDIDDQNLAFRNKYDKNNIKKNVSQKKSTSCLLCGSREKYNYEFAELSGKRLIKQYSLGTKVFFDWKGEKKSLLDIQTDISKNILNIQDLVDYQRLCFKMLFYVFHETWLVRFEERFENQNINTEMYEKSLKDLSETFKKLFIRNEVPYATYAKYYTSKLYIYSFKVNRGVGELVKLVKKEIMSPMAELLGIFVNDNHKIIADIKTFLGIKNKMWNATKEKKYSELFSHWESKINEFNRSLNFFFYHSTPPSFMFKSNDFIVYTF